MDYQPLAGRTITNASHAPAADVATFLLADLGAQIKEVHAGATADIVDMSGDQSAARVVLSPYGLQGAFADGPAHHSAVEAVGGAHMAQYTYEPGPAYLVTPYSSVGQGALAAAATIAAELGGQRAPIPVSALQGLMALQSGFYAFGADRDTPKFDSTPRGQFPTYSTYRCADDWIFIGASTISFMIKVLQVVGLEDLLVTENLAEGPRAFRGKPELAQRVWDEIGAQMARHPREHWLRIFEQAKVPAGPILTMEQALAHPHTQECGLAEPGTPIGRLKQLVTVNRRGDGRPRAWAEAGPLPLSGLRIVELAGYIAGAYPARLLADLGAEVVKVEPPDGDPFRGNGFGFAAWNHGKKGLALNLRNAAERERLLKLVAGADVLITNYRPDALARMGLDRPDMFAANPALIHLQLSAYGETGPLSHLPGFDPVIQGFTGIMRRQGGDGEPVKPQMAATDYLSAMLGAVGVLAALTDQRERGGGYEVRTSLLAGAMLFNYDAYEAVRAGRAYLNGGHEFKGPHPLNRLYQTRDGWLLTVLPGARDGGNAEARRYLVGAVRDDPREAALTRLAAMGVPSVPALEPHRMIEEPHFVENGLWLSFEQPGLGELTLPAPVLGPAGDGAPAPGLGQHNAEPELWRTLQPAGD